MAKKTKHGYAIAFVAFLGLFVLFIFPEPETNFLAYVATAGVFILIIVLLIKGNERIKKQSKPNPKEIHVSQKLNKKEEAKKLNIK